MSQKIKAEPQFQKSFQALNEYVKNPNIKISYKYIVTKPVVICILEVAFSKNHKEIFKGFTRCGEEDVFEEKTGKMFARLKANEKANNWIIKRIMLNLADLRYDLANIADLSAASRTIKKYKYAADLQRTKGVVKKELSESAADLQRTKGVVKKELSESAAPTKVVF